MAQADESGNKLRDAKLNCEAPITVAANQTVAWYLQKARYDMRKGNRFEPYLCGREAFQHIASSIDKARKSIDIVTWGFDPAMPIVREDPIYQTSFIRAEDGQLIEVDRDKIPSEKKWHAQVFSGWRREDTIGEMLINALKKNKDLKVRIVLWLYEVNFMTQNYVGFGTIGSQQAWMKSIMIGRNEKETGFQVDDFGGLAKDNIDKKKEKKLPITGADRIDMPDLLLRHRHPDAQEYSWQWYYRLLNAIELKQEGKELNNPFDRIAVTFRDKPATEIDNGEEDPGVGMERQTFYFAGSDHQKTVLIDIDDTSADAKPHGYIMGHNSLSNYWSDFPFVHRDKRNEMDSRPYHDFSMKVEGPLLVDISNNFCEAWDLNRVRNIDRSLLYVPTHEEKIALDKIIRPLGECLPRMDIEVHSDNSDTRTYYFPQIRKIYEEDPSELQAFREKEVYQKLSLGDGGSLGQIVRTRTDQEIHGYREKEIKDTYMHVTKMATNYMLIVNQYCQYAKLARHIKYWWKDYRDKATKGIKKHPKKETREELQNKQDSEWLYLFMGTARPEDPNAVFRAHEMANELGCGDQFPIADAAMYETPAEAEKRIQQEDAMGKDPNSNFFKRNRARTARDDDIARFKREQQLRSKAYSEVATPEELKELAEIRAAKQNKPAKFDQNYEYKDFEDAKIRTADGIKYDAPVHVPKSEITKLKIKPLFFMFYTKAPAGEIAQMPYVHAKLFVQDDAVFTLGSANLNIRSMAVDSEINVISDDKDKAQQFRTTLLRVYSGYPEDAIELKKKERAKEGKTFTAEDLKTIEEEFPNTLGVLNQEKLARVYSTFSRIMDKNLGRIEQRKTIQGCIAKFNDQRDLSAVRRG